MDQITDISELFEFLKNCSENPHNLIFRGVRKKSFKLVPSIDRLQD